MISTSSKLQKVNHLAISALLSVLSLSLKDMAGSAMKILCITPRCNFLLNILHKERLSFRLKRIDNFGQIIILKNTHLRATKICTKNNIEKYSLESSQDMYKEKP